jgi:predicted lipoprotein
MQGEFRLSRLSSLLSINPDMIYQNLGGKTVMRRSAKLMFTFAAAVVCLALLGACTVVKIEEDDGEGGGQYATWTKTGTGFQADEYVEAVWDERILPAYEQQSVDCTEVLSALRSDREGAIEKYGLARETGEPFFVFKVRGTCRVAEYDDSSRNGVIRVDMEPADGTVDATLQVGPVIRGTAIRDSMEFIRFTDVGNQLQFADLANELNARMRRDSVEPLDLPGIVGKRISFLGAFRLTGDEPLEDIVITPVKIDLLDGGA